MPITFFVLRPNWRENQDFLYGTDDKLKYISKKETNIKDNIILNDQSELIVSSKILTIINKFALTGIKQSKIQITNSAGKRFLNYYSLQIIGKSGDYDTSQLQPTKIDVGFAQLPAKKGFFLPQDVWDGSDIFHPSSRLTILLSEKAANIFKKFPEVTVTRLEDFVC